MILTQCAQCAAPLAHNAPRCRICKTRYCGRDCQKLHWKQGGHKAICQEIKRGGGAEKYHANKRYAEALAVAATACAEDTKGQACYICRGSPLEDEGGPRAHVCVPRDGRFRSRFVFGGAGEDFE